MSIKIGAHIALYIGVNRERRYIILNNELNPK